MKVYSRDNFAGRVDHVAAVIIRGGGTNRRFDGCFEMWDGDAVAAAIYERSLSSPRLAANLSRYLVIDSIRDCYDRYQGQNLSQVAATLRAQQELPTKPKTGTLAK